MASGPGVPICCAAEQGSEADPVITEQGSAHRSARSTWGKNMQSKATLWPIAPLADVEARLADIQESQAALLTRIESQHTALVGVLEVGFDRLVEEIRRPQPDRKPSRAPTFKSNTMTKGQTFDSNASASPRDMLEVLEEKPPPSVALAGERSSASYPMHMEESEEEPTCLELCRAALAQPFGTLVRQHMTFQNLDVSIAIVIILNTLAICAELQVRGLRRGAELEGETAGSGSSVHVFEMLEHVFIAIFTLELVFKLCVMRLGFFCRRSNLFDMILVVSSLIHNYVFEMLNANAGFNLTFMRIFSISRMARLLRIARVAYLFVELRVLVTTISGCFFSLLWSMVLLFVLMLMGGIFMCQMLADFISDESNDYAMRQWAYHYYGTSTRAVYTMFEVTMSGCFPNYTRNVVDRIDSGFAVFFIIYVSIVVFAIIRIISALFLNETLKVAGSDAETVAHQKAKDRQRYASKLRRFFEEADSSGDGMVDRDELMTILKQPATKAWLQTLELASSDLEILFATLDDGDGEISLDEFCTGALRIKGFARNTDVMTLLHKLGKLTKSNAILQLSVDELLRKAGLARPKNISTPASTVRWSRDAF